MIKINQSFVFLHISGEKFILLKRLKKIKWCLR